jgi:hypothetical protein
MLKVTGLDKLQRKLKDLGQRAESISERQNVPLPELLTSDFIRQCSRFQSVEEMFEESGFKIESAEDFASIPDDEWEDFISANTSFLSWEAMLREATGKWAARRLGL